MLFVVSFFILLLSPFSIASIENDIRHHLFSGYDKRSLPVKSNNASVELFYGNEITGLVYFDQKSEQIKLNFITTLIWRDEYLSWEDDIRFNRIDYIFVPSESVWQSDIELYNAGSSPEIFELKGQYKLFKNGFVQYIRPTAFSFSCKLSLFDFPFDSQECKMLFGSWKYPKAKLNLRPINQQEINLIGSDFKVFRSSLSNLKNISVSPLFSHNEWNIRSIDVIHEDKSYLCCPGDLWPNSEFIITLTRNPNKYIILIIMSVLVTISSLVVSLINIDNYRRTYVLVFIPLTLIWLQMHVSSKVPVIDYSTKLENIIQLCFYTTILSAFESGIIYNILLNHNTRIKKYSFIWMIHLKLSEYHF